MSENQRKWITWIAIAAIAYYCYTCCSRHDRCPAPQPVTPVKPAPVPVPQPAPKPAPKPWGNPERAPVGAFVGGNVAPDGTEIACDLPGDRHRKNKGGSDGAGLCVFTSIGHSADWQNVPVLIDFRDWMTRHPGGGYPTKVDQMITRICKEKNAPKPAYLQVEGSDISILKDACRAGLLPAVTYGVSPTGRYNGQKIAHMVSLVHADDKHFVILDNNYPGEDKYEWLTPEEFKRSYTTMGGGWSVILLNEGPPPVPRNGGAK